MTQPADWTAKVDLVDRAYVAVGKLHADVRPTDAEWSAATGEGGPARKFAVAAREREEQCRGDLPLAEFKDLVERWFKNVRECYRAVLRARDDFAPAP